MAGITVHMPEGMQPTLHIPNHIAKEWMEWGMLGYRDHSSEWGCAVKLHRESPFAGDVHVVDYHMYELEASGGYWESIEGERDRHAAQLIEEGKADELEFWNGLFHTHPIGSNATMSGTDIDQLKDLAGRNYWGISIICPANMTASVLPDKFLYHYADSRQFDNGMIVVDNMKPEIEKLAEDPWKDKAAKLAGMMHKRVVPPKSSGSTNNKPTVWRPSDPLPSDDEINRILREANDAADESAMMLEQMFRIPKVEIEAGDWVYVKSIAEYLGSVEGTEELVGRVIKVDMSTSGSLCSNGLWLCPQEYENDDSASTDFVYRLCEKGSSGAKLLNNQLKNKRPIRPTKKMFSDAGIPELFSECKDVTVNNKKKAVK